MSTVPIVRELERTEVLCRYPVVLRGKEKERRMLTVSPEMLHWVRNPIANQSLTAMKAKVRTHFSQFVKGERIDDCLFMKRVEDRRRTPFDLFHGVWSISPRFDPQYRFFGVFATLDWFVALTKQSRANLDRGGDPAWHIEIDKVLRVWSKLTDSRLPHDAPYLSGLLSNAEHCDDRW